MSTVSTIPGFYTVEEAAGIIGVSHSQVCRYIADGRLKAHDIGNQWLIEQADVHTFQRRPRGNPTFQRQKARGKES